MTKKNDYGIYRQTLNSDWVISKLKVQS